MKGGIRIQEGGGVNRWGSNEQGLFNDSIQDFDLEICISEIDRTC